MAQRVKCLPAMWETWVQSLGPEDPLEKEMANYYRPGGFDNKHLHLWFWRLGSPRSRCWLVWCLVRPLFLASCCVLTRQKKKVSVSRFVIPTLCDLIDCSPPGSSVHGILQARIQKWVAISFSRGSSGPRDHTLVPCIAGRFFTI